MNTPPLARLNECDTAPRRIVPLHLGRTLPPIIPSLSLDAANSDPRFYAAGGAVRRAVTAANAVTAPEPDERIAAVS